MTLREELNGEQKGGGGAKAADVKSILRMQHLQNLVQWAGGGEACMPSSSWYAAYLGHHLINCGEATGRTPSSPSWFLCQRCNSILQPGFNCTVRVETNDARVCCIHNKLSIPPQNYVVYTCRLCLQRNVKSGTLRNHMKEVYALKLKAVSELETTSIDQKLVSSESATKRSKDIDKNMAGTILSQQTPVSESISNISVMNPKPITEVTDENSAATPKLLSARKEKTSGSVMKDGNENNTAMPNAEEVVGKSRRKRRKGWSSLKEIAENSGRVNKRNIIPKSALPIFV